MDREVWSGLAVFAEIVDAGSFAAAAKRLGVSPSALSHANCIGKTISTCSINDCLNLTSNNTYRQTLLTLF